MTSGDLWWPRDYFFRKVDVKRVILIYKLPPLRKIWNLTQNDPKFEIWHQTRNFLRKFFVLFYWSFWAINWPYWTNLWFLIKYFKKCVGGLKSRRCGEEPQKGHRPKRHVFLNNLRYFTVSQSQPTLFKSKKTFALQKTYYWYKMRRLKNFKKKVAAPTAETFCLSFDTTFGTITWITWSKSP